MEKVSEYIANLEEGSFLFGIESEEVENGDVIVVKDGLEKILKKLPTLDWQTVVLTESRKKYLRNEILDYGKRIS